MHLFAKSLILVLLGTASILVAQTSDENWKHCSTENNPDAKIAGCAAIIQSGQVKGAELAMAFNNRGIAYSNKGDYDHAISDFTEAIRLKPDFEMAYDNRALAYIDHADYDHAIQDMNAAIKLNAKDADAYYLRATAYYKNQDAFHGIQDYTQAIQLNPKYFEAYYFRGYAYYEYGHFDEAIQDFSAAIKIKPDDPRPFKSRGDAYVQNGDYEHAIPDFTSAITLKPEDASLYASRCWARAIFNQLPDALDDCNKSLQIIPNSNTAALDSRGFTYLKMKNYDAAITDYKAALVLDPNLATSLYGRGLAERQKGRAAAASRDIAAAKSLLPQITDYFAKWGIPAHKP